MALESAYRIEVMESFQALQEALSSLKHHLLEDETLPAWFEPPTDLLLPPKLSIRAQAFGLIQQLEYLDHQKPREILVGSGLIAASPKTLETVLELNASKDRFKAAILALKKVKIQPNDPEIAQHIDSLLDKRLETTAKTLRKVGLSRLHLKQCYRRLVHFPKRPAKISWTWANTRAITRITVEQAEKLLLKQGSDASIHVQLNKLYALNKNEPLAIVQELAPHLRANVVFQEGADEMRRIMVKGPISIFYLATEGEPLPEIRPAGIKRGKDKTRPIRCDTKLESEPFLPSIRAHRYV